jgi:3-isopropylmalate/(R)-2-methylmalate dehydratase small subunit
VHLVSPATAAMTAVNGVISEPTADFCSRAINYLKVDLTNWTLTRPSGWQNVPFTKPNYTDLLTKFGVGEVNDFSGKVFYLPEANVDTDQIIPAKYLTETDKQAFGKHCLEDAPISAENRPKLFGSQILVAGENFGCGSSREHAPWALEGAGIRCVIAPSFARIFENNMFANGLLCITLPKSAIVELVVVTKPDHLMVDWEDGQVKCDDGLTWKFELSDYQKDLIRNGGSVAFMVKLAAELQRVGLLDKEIEVLGPLD